MEWQPIDTAPINIKAIIADNAGRVGEGEFRHVTAAGLRTGKRVGDVVADFISHNAWGECRCKAVAWMPMPEKPQRLNSPACAAFRAGPVE
jgi:hypothetical protein